MAYARSGKTAAHHRKLRKTAQTGRKRKQSHQQYKTLFSEIVVGVSKFCVLHYRLRTSTINRLLVALNSTLDIDRKKLYRYIVNLISFWVQW